MKHLISILSGFSLAFTSLAYGGEARSISIANEGGSASATATAVGNANALALLGSRRQPVVVAGAERSWPGRQQQPGGERGTLRRRRRKRERLAGELVSWDVHQRCAGGERCSLAGAC